MYQLVTYGADGATRPALLVDGRVHDAGHVLAAAAPGGPQAPWADCMGILADWHTQAPRGSPHKAEPSE